MTLTTTPNFSCTWMCYGQMNGFDYHEDLWIENDKLVTDDDEIKIKFNSNEISLLNFPTVLCLFDLQFK